MPKNSSKDIVVIDKNKVYTSYYARACKIVPDFMLVSISLGTPDGFNGGYYRDLNPGSQLLYNYKSGNISDAEYIETYTKETLDMLNANKVYNDLHGKVLLCYCGKDKFCHRKLVLDWLEKSLGKDIIGGEI